MPNTSSAKKANRQDKKRNMINKVRANKIRTVIRKMKDIIKEGDYTKATEFFKEFQAKVHKAVSKKVFVKNKASRIVSRINAKIKNLKD
ncbi:MAG: ribosomal protein S20 [Candidatus Xenolissoclinum pacificiensis L6]|uniref:Small ribosomal subunit protein bS20 n=1 Tax=Candidatus Xenolissoclinum pacificiensis L6 TaxID=1401685 RepID=W2V1C8_9RICK|nr:MAG: ribosomal protein S20 [Candidatus Xenolissoclinum pacificiensis L6]